MSSKYKVPPGIGGGGYIGTMSREAFAAYTSSVKSADCFQDDHDECLGQYDLGDGVEGQCGCNCHVAKV